MEREMERAMRSNFEDASKTESRSRSRTSMVIDATHSVWVPQSPSIDGVSG